MTKEIRSIVGRLLEDDRLEDDDLVFPNKEIGQAAFRINSVGRVLPSFITNTGYTSSDFRHCKVLQVETSLAPGTDSYFKLYPLYGDPAVHGWAALSPWLDPASIPQELEPVRGYVEREFERLHPKT